MEAYYIEGMLIIEFIKHFDYKKPAWLIRYLCQSLMLFRE